MFSGSKQTQRKTNQKERKNLCIGKDTPRSHRWMSGNFLFLSWNTIQGWVNLIKVWSKQSCVEREFLQRSTDSQVYDTPSGQEVARARERASSEKLHDDTLTFYISIERLKHRELDESKRKYNPFNNSLISWDLTNLITKNNRLGFKKKKSSN